MKKTLLTIVSALALTTSLMHAQNTTWFFGANGGLQITGATTTPVAGSSINTSEGCAVIVNTSNQPVMYTDGSSVWNGAHAIQTATAGTLGGNPSSTQTAIIIPIPGQNCNRYFIFTTQAVESDYGGAGGNTGLRVSLATVTGVAPATTVTIPVADRNQLLNTGGALMSERLTATSDGSGGYWVIAHGAGTYGGANFTTPQNTTGERMFYTVHVTAATTTIASLVVNSTSFGASPHMSCQHPYPGGSNQFRTQGQMKVSPNGQRLAVAMSNLREVQLYSFNQGTGAITGQVLLNSSSSPAAFNNTSDGSVYGLEFSPNSNVLYVSTTAYGSSKTVYQFDLTAASISGSRIAVAPGTTVDYTYGQLQLGPNGRIYVAKNPNGTGSTTLDVINNPNVVGAGCGYAASAVTIGGSCRLGLPTVLVNNPCEGNGGNGTDCVCNSTSTITGTTLLKDGTGSVTLSLNSGTMQVKRLKITLVNFTHAPSAPECLLCESNAASQFGTITNTPIVNSTTGVLAPATSSGTANWSKQISWVFATPAVVNGTVVLNVRFPGVLNLSCCGNRVEYCLNVEYIDDLCNICENTTCTTSGSKQAITVKQNNEVMSEPVSPEAIQQNEQKNTSANDALQLFPNPTSANVTVELSAADLNGMIQVINTDGKMVVQQRCTGPVTVLDTGNLPNGMYTVAYVSGDSRISKTLLIQH